MEKRPYGKTDERLSIVGFGGILVMNTEPADASALVGAAIDRGINYFDVAPSYGNAEERLGPALEPYRDGVFLACKTGKRDKAGAAEELRASLGRMRTDHFDLYQLHAMSSQEDLEKALGPGGALEAFLEARDAGLVRYLGFSAHSAEVALQLLDQFAFDSVLFPVNYVLYSQAGFGPQVVEKAAELGIGRFCLKAMAHTQWREGEARTHDKCWYEPITDPELGRLAIRFTLSQPVTAAIPPGHPDLFNRACDAAEFFTPITDEEKAHLFQEAQGLQTIFKLAA